MVNLSFNIELSPTANPNRTLVSNIGRAIVKELAVKLEGNEILSIDDFDILACYRDLWKTKSEKGNAIRQGIISNGGCKENRIKLRINTADKTAANKQDKAIADRYGNKFVNPLDFEMLGSASPYYRAGLCYEIKTIDCNRVIKSAVASPDAKYKIEDISLEYEIVTQPTLAKYISGEYQSMVLLYDIVLRHKQINPSSLGDTIWCTQLLASYSGYPHLAYLRSCSESRILPYGAPSFTAKNNPLQFDWPIL